MEVIKAKAVTDKNGETVVLTVNPLKSREVCVCQLCDNLVYNVMAVCKSDDTGKDIEDLDYDDLPCGLEASFMCSICTTVHEVVIKQGVATFEY